MKSVILLYSVLSAVTKMAGAHPPHIVIIIADDMGWNDVSFHGSSQIMTPNIDALAFQGVILNHHYAQPSCSPSRSALLTGHYPVHTGIHVPLASGSAAALSLNHTLLPQYLSRLGYHTHLVGKWHLGSHSSEYLPTHRGFRSHFGFWNGYIGYFDGIHEDGLAGIDARRNKERIWEEFVGHYATDLFTQEATSIIKSHNVAEGPLFLQVALSAPHAGNRGSELQVRDLGENEKQHAHIPEIHRRLYAGMVRGVDDAVGAIFEALSSRHMLDNSIVLFTSDNGAPTLDPIWNYNNYGSNWPLRGMKLSCHEGGVRVAAALWSSLVPGGRVTDELIHAVDWLPTLYNAAGGNVEDLEDIDGISQWEMLRDGQSTVGQRSELLVELNSVNRNEAFIKWPWKVVKYNEDNPYNAYTGDDGRGSEVPQYSVDEVIGSATAQALSLQKPAHDLLALRALATIDKWCPLVVNHSTPDRPCDQHYCLFNLEVDPCETSDLSHVHPGVVSNLVELLDVYRGKMVPAPSNIRDPRADPRLWENYWTTWADSSALRASYHSVSFLLPGLSILLIVAWNYLCLGN